MAKKKPAHCDSHFYIDSSIEYVMWQRKQIFSVITNINERMNDNSAISSKVFADKSRIIVHYRLFVLLYRIYKKRIIAERNFEFAHVFITCISTNFNNRRKKIIFLLRIHTALVSRACFRVLCVRVNFDVRVFIDRRARLLSLNIDEISCIMHTHR